VLPGVRWPYGGNQAFYIYKNKIEEMIKMPMLQWKFDAELDSMIVRYKNENNFTLKGEAINDILKRFLKDKYEVKKDEEE